MTPGGWIDPLRALASGIRPDGVGSGGMGAAKPSELEGLFDSLLRKAERGEAASGRPVDLAKGADFTLSEDQLERLTHAADRAEAAGLSQVVVMMDGEAYRMDVLMRRVTERVDPSEAGVLSGIDGVVSLPPSDEDEDGEDAAVKPGVLPLPGGPGSNESLMRVLGESRRAG